MPTNAELLRQIELLNDKLARQTRANSEYRAEFQKLAEIKSERDLYCELSSVFVGAKDFSEVFTQTVQLLSSHFKAKYCGIFWLDNKNEFFTYRFGKGYLADQFPPMPYPISLMGEALLKRQCVWEAAANNNSRLVVLGQSPAEYNVLLAPVLLFGNASGVIRIANIDPLTASKALATLEIVSTLFCSSLERLMLQNQNELNLKSLDVSFSVARLIENTLDRQEILNQIFSKIPNLYPTAGCLLVARTEDGLLRPHCAWPETFVLSGSRASETIYLSNLFTTFPNGQCLIKNIHGQERKWSWPGAKVRSLCMAPIKTQHEVEGVLITLSPPEVTYDATHANLLGIVAAQTSMTLERALYFKKQENLARRDGLTGLFNHRTFQEALREEINRLVRYPHPLSLIMLDIDHFKKVNDTHGHPAGDEVIKLVAGTLGSMIRTTDKAFRYGGEEFAVLLPETTRENGALLAERIRKKIEEDRSIKNIPVTISLGVVGLLPMETAESLIKRADTALYTAKEGGRNRVVIG